MAKDYDFQAAIDEINHSIDMVEEKLYQGLRRIGEESIRIMRETNEKMGRDYQDQTGNLRSSCGYAIAVNGNILQIGGFIGTKEGKETGESLARRIAINESANRFCLVLVAGMEYASYVQAMGYDVMESAEINAIKRAKELTDILISRYGNKENNG